MPLEEDGRISDSAFHVRHSALTSPSVWFEENLGQADANVKFLVHTRSANLWLTRSEIWLQLHDYQDHSFTKLRLGLAGANPIPELIGLERLQGRVNYLLGNDSSQWHTAVPAYAKVRYSNVYPGVDLVYHGNQEKLEYDFVVQPGADPHRIVLEFGGAENLSLDSNGDLLVAAGRDGVRQHKPVVFQEIDGTRKLIAANYRIQSANQAAFELGAYDPTHPLIIDPVLAYSAKLGGSGRTQGLGIALDGLDNAYVTGNTMAPDFPTQGGVQPNFTGIQDVFVAKFDTNGTMLFSTLIGGNGIQSGQGIALDFHGNIFITGYTSSTNFPVVNPLQATNAGKFDAFIVELDPNGSKLLFSTYLGGADFDAANGITLDPIGSPIITGHTLSKNFRMVNAVQSVYGGQGDAFVTKLNTNLTALVYSTYLGGSDSENNGPSYQLDDITYVRANFGGAIASDFNGNAYITGWTHSMDFPVLNAFQPTNAAPFPGFPNAAFVTKLDPLGRLVYSTYFGGQNADYGRAIGVDLNGKVYFAGSTLGGTLPVTTNAFQQNYGGNFLAIGDGFLAALDSTGTNLIYCTYLGGSGDEQINGISVRFDGAVAVTGFTDSLDFPVLNAIQTSGNQGFFASHDGGATWTASHQGLNQGIITAIGVDPFNPSTIYILAGDLYRSVDGGQHWTSINSNVKAGNAPAHDLIAFDPKHHGVLYVAGYSAVFKTADGGNTWVALNSGLPSSPYLRALAVDPQNPSTIYAGTFQHGVFKSTDAGTNWTAVSNGLNNMTVGALLVDPLNSSNVYVGVVNSFSSSLFVSTNAAASWAALHPPAIGPVSAIVPSPMNPSAIYVLEAADFSESATLCLTTNAGATWTQLIEAVGENFTALAVGGAAAPVGPPLSVTLSNNNIVVSWPASFAGFTLQTATAILGAQWQKVTQVTVVHADKNTITFPASSAIAFYRLAGTNSATGSEPVIYLGTDQPSQHGVLRSSDGGKTWEVAGLREESVNALTVRPAAPDTVYAGLAGGYDAFITSFSPDGRLRASTFLGGSAADEGNAIALAMTTGLVVGTSASLDFPFTPRRVGSRTLLNETPEVTGTLTDLIFLGAVAAFDCPQDRIISLKWPVGDIAGQGLSAESVQLVSGALPPGLALDPNFKRSGNLLSGTLTTPGHYSFVLHFSKGLCNWDLTYNVDVVKL